MEHMFQETPAKITVSFIKTISRLIEEYSLRTQLFPSSDRIRTIQEMKDLMATLYAMLDISVHNKAIKIDQASECGTLRY